MRKDFTFTKKIILVTIIVVGACSLFFLHRKNVIRAYIPNAEKYLKHFSMYKHHETIDVLDRPSDAYSFFDYMFLDMQNFGKPLSSGIAKTKKSPCDTRALQPYNYIGYSCYEAGEIITVIKYNFDYEIALDKISGRDLYTTTLTIVDSCTNHYALGDKRVFCSESK